MRKILLSAAATLMLFSCQNESVDTTESAINVNGRRMCASQDVLQAQLEADPTLAIRMNEIETFTKARISKLNSNFRLVNGKIVIPVVVNVLYRTATENIQMPKYNHK
ncbi:hypothetical protein [Flavobacterium sp.]|jgi:hypothetical protein|uniref:hypothetical protein n=1 Tax=Flavobacterium sp. TaxID=239 RepID=UPI0037BF047B